MSAARAFAGPADTDGDGLPDSWEIQYFGNLDQTGTGDPDGDGFSNWAEYVMGTNPAVAEAVPPYWTTAQWTATGLSGGGAEYNPTPAPNHPELMFTSCDMGGFYKSTDGGRHWKMINGTYVNGVPGYRDDDCGPEIDPKDENIMMVSRNGGLARTTDAGETFTEVSSVEPTAMAFHAEGPTLAFMSGPSGGAFRLYKSTDTGATWTEVAGWDTSVKIRELFIDPGTAIANATLYASTAQGIYKSTNGGSTWTARNTGLGSTDIIDMKYGMKGGQVVLFATTGDTVYKSVAGGTWTSVMNGLPAGNFYGTVGVCAENGDVAYAGSDEYGGGPTIYKTSDGGATWTLKLINPNSPKFPAATTIERDWQTIHLGWGWQGDPHQVNVCQTDPNIVAFSCDGDCLRSDDGGDHWFSCNSDETAAGSDWWRTTGYGVTTCYQYTVDPRQPNRHYICYTDIGFARSVDSGATWVHSPNGSPWRNTFYEIACDPSVDGVIWGAATNKHDLPQWSAIQTPLTDPVMVGGIVKSTDWGAHWTDMGHSTGLATGVATSVIVDPASPAGSRTLYCVIFAKGVYKSADGGATWTQKNNGLSMPNNTNYWKIQRASDGTLYCAITHRIDNTVTPRKYYKGGLFKSTDGANTWALVNTTTDLIWIANFSIDPNDPGKIYVGCINAAGGLAGGGGYKTTDGGTTWTKMFDYSDTWNVVPDPGRPDRLLAGVLDDYSYDGMGVFMSDDGGATWWKSPTFPFKHIGGYQATYDPADSENVYFTTYGGSVFKARIPHPTAPQAAFTVDRDNGAAPLTVNFDSSTSAGDVRAYTWDFADGSFSHAANPTHVFSTAGTYTVKLTVEGGTGASSTTKTISVTPPGWDIDGDGLPDAWEMQYFGNLDQGPNDDPDGDGLTNIREYELATDPTQADGAGPSVVSAASLPTVVREGVDAGITVTASATDIATGNSKVTAAEYFVDAVGADGAGTAMSASDGQFDSPVEPVTAAVNTSGWHGTGHAIEIHAKDALDHWGPYATLNVPVVEGIPPGKVTDLAARPMVSLVSIPVTVEDYSGQYVTYDAGEIVRLGAVGLTPIGPLPSFPKDFTIAVSQDNTSWDTVTPAAEARAFKAAAGSCLWQFDPAGARYVRISGAGIHDSANAVVYKSLGTAVAGLTWTAPADDGYTGTAASEYDLRYSPSPIPPFDLWTRILVDAPKPPEQQEDCVVGVDLTGTVFFAVRTADDVSNWSAPSDPAWTSLYSSGFISKEPANGTNASALTAPVFRFGIESVITTPVIRFSSCAGFPSVATARGDGQIDKCLTFALKTTSVSWTPTASQWKAIKALACTEGKIWWRLEGKHASYGRVFGPARYCFFDCGEIGNLKVDPSHDKDGAEALWPDRSTPPKFSWTYDGSGVIPAALMTYFWVDISADENVPLGDSNRTATLGGSGITGSSYTLTAAQWKKVRQLAAKGQGTLYWRVRGKDATKVLECASAVKMLVVDGGALVLTPFKLTDSPCTAAWRHTDKGPVAYKYYLQISPDDSFDKREAWVAQVPGTAIADTTYTLPEKVRASLVKRAQNPKSGTTAAYCRIRAEDADKAFVTYSSPVNVWP